MKNIKLTLSYDGTDFYGFQIQKNLRTVASELIKAIEKINGVETNIICSGRTDTGVHADGQVVNFFTEKTNLTEYNWVCALNSYLPRDIRILDAEFVSEKFNARRSALFREYQYRIINAKTISALDFRYCSHYFYEKLDIELLQKYADYLLGENDFTSFCCAGDSSLSKCRFIHSVKFERFGDLVTFKIIGNAFLQHMIRIIIGTLLMLHKEKKEPVEMQKILQAKNRDLAGTTYFSKGLCFKRVYYSKEELNI
ncbi:MAG TPA: tRNA pseudouridine(38-40) synthase TruA [Spirochaetota bacterium]|nr:tRNA pseudouridine(38-40) synthase TruA [Spirochaetota bacterium]